MVRYGKLSFELKDAPTATNIKGNFDWDVSIKTDAFEGNHTAGTTVTQQGQVGAANAVANTVFQINKSDLKDGTTITLDGKTVTATPLIPWPWALTASSRTPPVPLT